MTGTAETEAPEFDKIYKLEVFVIPTNRPLIRVEHADVVYRTEPEKFGAVVDEIKELHASGRPVLVGTISIEKSEHLSGLLKRAGIKHVVLNAKYHEREAEIVSQAGRFGAVTIATNMAGRGTDIILGGVPDHRVKAILQEKELDPDRAPEAEHEAARKQALDEMAQGFKREMSSRKPDADERRLLAHRYLGLLAALTPGHPSLLAMEEIARDSSELSAYLERCRALTRKVKERISRSFYPQGEKPVDFLAVHPLRAPLASLAQSAVMPRIEAFLDGNERERVVALGGVHILATERHEARRIDNQLRGRAGRQGDPGSSRFYVSLQDDLMRIFGSDRISGLMLKLGMEEGVPIEHRMVTRSIERAQSQVESQNFAVRKHLLEYDDVMNKQREAIYGLRRRILEGRDTREHLLSLTHEIVEWYLESYCDERSDVEEWNLEGLRLALRETFGHEMSLSELQAMGRGEMAEAIDKRLQAQYLAKEDQIGAEIMRLHARLIMLHIVDSQWKDHLYAIDHLKEGIGLRSYGQRDPLVEYKKESFEMFQDLTNRIDEEMLRWSFLYQPVPTARGDADGSDAAEGSRTPEAPWTPPRRVARNLSFNNPSEAASSFARSERSEAKGGMGVVETVRREGKKVGRNEPCPCGSGKKYKKCHGA